MYNDDCAPIRRRTRLTGEAEELRYLALELETEHDAHVSRGRAPWRGLSGHDPLDDIPDEEFGERQWEDWHDGMYDEDDPERPQRRRPSGRELDIVPPVATEVTVRVDPAIAAAFAARQAQAQPGSSWAVDGGRVTVEGSFKVWRGTCAHCSEPFEQRRPASQNRKWRKSCGDECAKALDRAKSRERMRLRRGTAAA
ncbi:hypothetical protein ACFVP3_23760 [Streptomyces sp. NPDC057806]|uniref:hypothetical protein n=1 Tax=Streptomyces sp. NPDC057806 TaxID=3346255 RepID=UPI003695D151